MPTYTPSGFVAGAPRVQLPFGLFSVLAFRPEDSARWQGGGVNWEYFESATLGAIGPVQKDQSDTYGLPKQLRAISDSGTPDGDGAGSALPFSVYSPFVQTPVGWSVEDIQQRAVDMLLAFEQELAESLFWSGEAGNTPSLSDPGLSVGSFELDKAYEAVGKLEDFLANTYGSLGVLHMSRLQATALMNKGVLKADGPVLRTILGTPVVAGGGYPDGVIRATPALFGYRSSPFFSSERRGDLFDTTKNDLYAIAERTYLIGFDPTGVGSATITS
jgi:hypothetical protein